MASIGPMFGGERENSAVACRRTAGGSGPEAEGRVTLRQMRGAVEGVVDILQRGGDTALTWADGHCLFGAAGAETDALLPDPLSRQRMGERHTTWGRTSGPAPS
jgi:hypothetical protein